MNGRVFGGGGNSMHGGGRVGWFVRGNWVDGFRCVF